MSFRRIAQGVSLVLFLGALMWAAGSWEHADGLDIFLRLDPLTAAVTIITAREFILGLIPGLIILGLALIAGRIFCGYLCPMGVTLDVFERVAAPRVKPRALEDRQVWGARLRGVKYLFLLWIIGAALVGVSFAYLGSPVSWVTRFYGLCVYPLWGLFADGFLGAVGPALSRAGFQDIGYIQISRKVFAGNLAFAASFLVIASLGLLAPRFWCRFLCPAGALLALCSRKPLLRRRVGDNCAHCGRCVRVCPTGAIMEEPEKTAFSECVVCLDCVRVCPVDAVSFGKARGASRASAVTADPGRRAALTAACAGLLTGGVLRTSLAQPYPLAKESAYVDEGLIRPPGALPEPLFLGRCIRCGECMKACPTNTLQPTWWRAGPEGIFTPVLTMRLAACAQNCTTCGQVCPTGAIRNLPLIEKRHAKLGTAWIIRQNCLVWEQDKKCLVCDEACPYDAVSFRPVPGLSNPAPFVQENRCLGCGWCETRCPVTGAAAIRVNVIGEVRLAEGSYQEKAREYGLVFRKREKSADRLAPGGFEDVDGARPSQGTEQNGETSGGLPPGFTEIK
jgi:MauM/NapG family ferredoxin protein